MEGGVSSYSSLVDNSVFANAEASHDDNSSEEAWLDDNCDSDNELQNEWKLRRDKFYTDGYREGIIEGQKDAAQEGFNLGFKDSVMGGYNWGIVRGLTSALANLPDTMKEKLMEKDEVRQEFMNLHGDVDSVSTEAALTLFYENMKKGKSGEASTSDESEKSGEASTSDESETSLTHQSNCGGLEILVRKLELLLKECPAINASVESSKHAVTHPAVQESKPQDSEERDA